MDSIGIVERVKEVGNPHWEWAIVVIILMGVAGSGKTTVGGALAARLRWPFSDADQFHSAQNREKMSGGIPLSDEDRAPWLATLRSMIEKWVESRADAVLACSALKASYRDLLSVGPVVKFVYLKGSRELIERRLAARRSHFFDPHLLDSQFSDLEEPTAAMVVDIAAAPQNIVESIICALSL